MGIYPETRYKEVKTPSGGIQLQKITTAPGVEHVVIYQAITELEIRTNCYCCSCDDDPGVDPYCRNHGWAGTRRCDKHGIAGDDTDDDGDPITESVQEVNDRNRARRLANRERRGF